MPETTTQHPIDDQLRPIHIPTHTCYEGDQIVNPEDLDAILQDHRDRIVSLEKDIAFLQKNLEIMLRMILRTS